MEDEKPVSNCGISSISMHVEDIQNYTMKLAVYAEKQPFKITVLKYI